MSVKPARLAVCGLRFNFFTIVFMRSSFFDCVWRKNFVTHWVSRDVLIPCILEISGGGKGKSLLKNREPFLRVWERKREKELLGFEESYDLVLAAILFRFK